MNVQQSNERKKVNHRDRAGWQPDDWVPVEERRFGLERRTIAPALAMLGFALIVHLGIPALDAAVPVDDEIRSGDVILVGPTVSFVPTASWDLKSGVRADNQIANAPGSAVVVRGEATVTVTAGPFEGDSKELLGQVQKTSGATDVSGLRVVSEPSALTTDDGEDGLVARYDSTTTKGVIAAFVIDGTGVEVVATGTSHNGRGDAMSKNVASMIASISLDRESEQ